MTVTVREDKSKNRSIEGNQKTVCYLDVFGLLEILSWDASKCCRRTNTHNPVEYTRMPLSCQGQATVPSAPWLERQPCNPLTHVPCSDSSSFERSFRCSKEHVCLQLSSQWVSPGRLQTLMFYGVGCVMWPQGQHVHLAVSRLLDQIFLWRTVPTSYIFRPGYLSQL